jgi:hypothetical protein
MNGRRVKLSTPVRVISVVARLARTARMTLKLGLCMKMTTIVVGAEAMATTAAVDTNRDDTNIKVCVCMSERVFHFSANR